MHAHTIFVTNLFDMPHYVRELAPARVVSIIQPELQPVRPDELPAAAHLRVGVHDISEQRQDHILPERRDIEDLIQFAHGWNPAEHLRWPAFIVVGVVVLMALEAVRRRRAVGWLAATFFLLLAPTSSIMPITDLMVEHRMYLALIPWLTLLVLGAHQSLGRAPLAPRARS